MRKGALNGVPFGAEVDRVQHRLTVVRHRIRRWKPSEKSLVSETGPKLIPGHVVSGYKEPPEDGLINEPNSCSAPPSFEEHHRSNILSRRLCSNQPKAMTKNPIPVAVKQDTKRASIPAADVQPQCGVCGLGIKGVHTQQCPAGRHWFHPIRVQNELQKVGYRRNCRDHAADDQFRRK